MQHNFGFIVSNYSAIFRSDIGGIVSIIGANATYFKQGAKVTAFAPDFDKQGAPKHGAFQEYVIVPAPYAVKIPARLSSNEGAMLLMAIQNVITGLSNIGLPLEFAVSKEKRDVLIWGGCHSQHTGERAGFSPTSYYLHFHPSTDAYPHRGYRYIAKTREDRDAQESTYILTYSPPH